MKLCAAIVLLLPLIHSNLHTQCNAKDWRFDESEKQSFSIGRFLSDVVTPQIILDTKTIRTYVRDPRFKTMTQRCGDIRAMDAVYLKGLHIADYNIARALFLAMMAVLEHQKVDVKMPLLESIGVPLTFEEDSIFKARLRNLPSHLYSDTPPEGDKDKLQHFFASAYLAYASESPELARTTGNLVEWTEARFIVGGADDPRDRRANEQGKAFGRDLLIVKTLLPSDYMQLGVEKGSEQEKK